MRNLLSAVLVFYCVVPSLIAQTSGNSLGTNDPDAKKILESVTSKFKSYRTVKALFQLQIENSAGKVQGTKKGTAYMKGNKYKLELNDQIIFCDGSKVWTYDKSSNEVQVSKVDPSGNSFTPQKIFTNFFDKDFLYKLNGDKKLGAKIAQEIELTPTDKNKAFFKILAYIDKKSKNIISTKVFEKNGNRYSYSITSLVPNSNLEDNLFIFDASKYPGVEVIDLQ
ncbi:MAG: outer membrane lipoprotein carrier protein LolA [Bacteroidetes bacterium]|nr:outer membrane lipoprotein carrier protein LolA [Bacteroidota bacterium]